MTPTPTETPQWAIEAAKEIVPMPCGWATTPRIKEPSLAQRSRTAEKRHQVAAIITKHAPCPAAQPSDAAGLRERVASQNARIDHLEQRLADYAKGEKAATERAERAESDLAQGRDNFEWLNQKAAEKGIYAHQIEMERATLMADLAALRALAEELAEALDSIPPCDVSGDAYFVYKAESWKWAEAMERRNVALARFRDAANPASGAAITPDIHRSE